MTPPDPAAPAPEVDTAATRLRTWLADLGTRNTYPPGGWLTDDVADVLAALDAARSEGESLRIVAHLGRELDNHHNANECPYCTAPLTAARAETAAVREELARWTETARQFCQNQDYWRERAEAAEADLAAARAAIGRVEDALAKPWDDEEGRKFMPADLIRAALSPPAPPAAHCAACNDYERFAHREIEHQTDRAEKAEATLGLILSTGFHGYVPGPVEPLEPERGEYCVFRSGEHRLRCGASEEHPVHQAASRDTADGDG